MDLVVRSRNVLVEVTEVVGSCGSAEVSRSMGFFLWSEPMLGKFYWQSVYYSRGVSLNTVAVCGIFQRAPNYGWTFWSSTSASDLRQIR